MGKRILIAEDEEAIARLVKASLQRAGHEGVIALDGRAALKLLETEKFDFVFLDLLMPYYDGTEVLRRIRTMEATRDLPVVILATCPPTEAEQIIAAYEMSPTKFIRKPFNPQELLDAVDGASA